MRYSVKSQEVGNFYELTISPAITAGTMDILPAAVYAGSTGHEVVQLSEHVQRSDDSVSVFRIQAFKFGRDMKNFAVFQLATYYALQELDISNN